jgi:hypothetical protein
MTADPTQATSRWIVQDGGDIDNGHGLYLRLYAYDAGVVENVVDERLNQIASALDEADENERLMVAFRRRSWEAGDEIGRLRAENHRLRYAAEDAYIVLRTFHELAANDLRSELDR